MAALNSSVCRLNQLQALTQLDVGGCCSKIIEQKKEYFKVRNKAQKKLRRRLRRKETSDWLATLTEDEQDALRMVLRGGRNTLRLVTHIPTYAFERLGALRTLNLNDSTSLTALRSPLSQLQALRS